MQQQWIDDDQFWSCYLPSEKKDIGNSIIPEEHLCGTSNHRFKLATKWSGYGGVLEFVEVF